MSITLFIGYRKMKIELRHYMFFCCNIICVCFNYKKQAGGFKMKKLLIISVAVFAVLSMSSGLRAQEMENGKSSWYIGFGFGTGDGEYTADGNTITYDDFFEGVDDTTPKIAFNFGLGFIFSPSLHLGFEANALRQEGTYLGVTVGLQINNYLGVVTFFPTGQGLYARAGLGASAIVLDVESSYGSDSTSETGQAFLIGVGYAIKLGQTFHLTLNLDYSMQSYDTDYDLESNFWAFYVSFYWF
jgi:hypothetical protein